MILSEFIFLELFFEFGGLNPLMLLCSSETDL